MTTSTLIYVDGMPTVIFDHGPRSRWADAWRNARLGGGADEPLIDEAYAALNARKRAKMTATLKDRLEMSQWSNTEIPF
jgi:hypothetical protein